MPICNGSYFRKRLRERILYVLSDYSGPCGDHRLKLKTGKSRQIYWFWLASFLFRSSVLEKVKSAFSLWLKRSTTPVPVVNELEIVCLRIYQYSSHLTKQNGMQRGNYYVKVHFYFSRKMTSVAKVFCIRSIPPVYLHEAI